MKPGNVHIHPAGQAFTHVVAERIIQIGQESLAQRGRFYLALSGGSTPRPIYSLLATPAYAARMDWSRTHVFFGDERYVPPGHADSNYRMAHETLLQHVSIPAEHIHPVPVTPSGAVQSAREYAAELCNTLPAEEDGIPVFDLILLGAGTDGHTASLFPDTPAVDERNELVTAVYLKKSQTWRVSLTLPIINRARQILFMVTGADKAAVVARVFGPQDRAAILPLQRVRPHETEWYLDEDAAQRL